eukprot:15469952-Alexandrium_andersonii.AAC.1
MSGARASVRGTVCVFADARAHEGGGAASTGCLWRPEPGRPIPQCAVTSVQRSPLGHATRLRARAWLAASLGRSGARRQAALAPGLEAHACASRAAHAHSAA